ncbi:MAG: proline racemase family protein [Phycisphaerae bacterium]|nr:proline racemase family protein [Phycisphaerae bacterium]
MTSIRVIDSHTEGEPTRVVLDGFPDLGGGTVAQQLRVLREHHDQYRSAVVNEPRGSDYLVGALICPPSDPRATCGVIFFNNVGYLNACGHGTIGLAATLAHLGRIGPGSHVVETPVGLVTIHLAANGAVSIENVPSYRFAAQVPIRFDWRGRLTTVRGDIAWGGNWFYLVSEHGQTLATDNIESLTEFAWAIRQALERAGTRGDKSVAHGLIDHVELFGPPTRPDADSRNFVLCPGKAYDRSPCGTGTSAKMACLFADGKLAPGQPWRQESIIGSRFVGSIRLDGNALVPTLSGNAHITAEAVLRLDDRDPFRYGIRT